MQNNHIEDLFPDLNKMNSYHEYLETVIKWENRMKRILLFFCHMYILVQLVTPSPSYPRLHLHLPRLHFANSWQSGAGDSLKVPSASHVYSTLQSSFRILWPTWAKVSRLYLRLFAIFLWILLLWVCRLGCRFLIAKCCAPMQVRLKHKNFIWLTEWIPLKS